MMDEEEVKLNNGNNPRKNENTVTTTEHLQNKTLHALH